MDHPSPAAPVEDPPDPSDALLQAIDECIRPSSYYSRYYYSSRDSDIGEELDRWREARWPTPAATVNDTAAKLESAAEALREKRPKDALDALLHVWRQERWPTVADAVVQLADRLASTYEPVRCQGLGLSANAWTRTWYRRLVAADAGELTVLLPWLREGKLGDVSVRLRVLGAMPPDPRVGRQLVELIRFPTSYGEHAVTFLRDALVVLVKNADPAIRLELDELTAMIEKRPWGETSRQAVERIREAAKTIDDAWRTSSFCKPKPADHAAVEDVMELVRAIPLSKQEEYAATREAFLRAVAESPQDDDVRLVFADWLNEKGDPYGEFINLQYMMLDGVLNKDQESRISTLLKTHEREWLGPLYPVVKDAVFERGFLTSCAMKCREPGKVLKVLEDPRWSTVRDLTWSPRCPQEIFLHPGMPSLRTLGGISEEIALRLVQDKVQRLIECIVFNVWVGWWTPASLEELGQGTGLPRLRELRYTYRQHAARKFYDAEEFETLWTTPLAKRLEAVRVIGRHADVHSWWRSLDKLGDACFRGRLEISVTKTRNEFMTLERGEDGRFSVLRLGQYKFSSLFSDLDDLESFMEGFPSDAFTRIEISDYYHPHKKRVTEILGRQERLEKIVMPSEEIGWRPRIAAK